MPHVLYHIVNRENRKSYIGAHSCGPACRNGCTYMGSGIALKNAIKKYGIEAFQKTILATCDSVDALYALEAAIVDEAFVARQDTYNLTPGGGSPPITTAGSVAAQRSAAARTGRLRGPYQKRKTRDGVDAALQSLTPRMRLR